MDHLDVIPMIRAVGKDPPVIVVAEEDSLDLERRARQHPVFYYLVHPLEQNEVKAVLDDVLRHANA
jgi:DNA-binding response OmpR family regulator